MFGAFRPSSSWSSGLLWKTPWRMSRPRKSRHRQRLKAVDDVISTVSESGVHLSALTKALALPKQAEMSPRDKYTVFCRSAPGYRKSVHKVPKFTRLTLGRQPPLGY